MRYSRLCVKWVLLAAVLLFGVGTVCAQDIPFDWDSAQQIYPGIKRVNIKVTTPRKMNIDCMRIDTKTKNLRFYTTPRCENWTANESETVRLSTRQFMRDSQSTQKKIVAAINCDAFSPWPVPYNKSTITNLLGLAVSEGVLVSPPSGSPSFIIWKDGSRSIQITNAETDTGKIELAVSGFGLVLQDGKVLAGDKSIHPRTGIGISKDTRYVYFITIDGRQAASAGAMTGELGEWLLRFGADSGINLDGGGSTTMAWWDPSRGGADKSVLVNVPVGGGALYSERFNGNNLGVYYAGGVPAASSSKSKKRAAWAVGILAAVLVFK